MEKVNICRAITLYNNFMPAEKSAHNWEYCAFGPVDGIHVGEVLKEKDIPHGIWREQCKLADGLERKYVAQQVYILKYDSIQNEEKFWALGDDFPFLFFMRIQCGENKELIWKNINRLENILCIDNEIKGSVYLTLDNADLFIVLKSKKYEQGAGMIDSLYSNNNLSFQNEGQCTLKNSFTVFAVKHSWIDDFEKSYFDNTSYIEEVFIKIIKKEYGDIESVQRELDRRKELFVNKEDVSIKRNTILGIDDYLISIKNISWYDFLQLYKRDDGIFCNWHPIYQENIAAATTLIKTNLVSYEPYLKENNLTECRERKKERELENIYKSQIDKLSEKLEQYEENAQVDEGIKELKLIINVLPKFAGEIFNDYMFFPIISPLNALLDILTDKKIKKKELEPFFKFLKGFSMYVQDSVRLDKHSMQALDFNTKIYDVPCKLNAFYYALIYNINKILSVPTEDAEESVHKYEFLVVPGLTQVEDVRELYVQASNTIRLMEIELPERNYYKIREMMIILTHELAHYVGGKYRLREDRYGYLISSYAHIYISYIRNAFLKEDIILEQEIVERLENRATKLLMEAMERDTNVHFVNNTRVCNLDSDHCNDICGKNDQYLKHFFTFLKTVDITMTDIVHYGLDSIFSPILFETEHKEKQKRREIIRAASERFIYKSIISTTRLTSQTTLDVLKMLYEECFADLMAILLLDISIKDYISAILYSAKQQRMTEEELMVSDVMYRVVVVLICVLRFNINDYNAEKILEEVSEEPQEYKVVESAFRRWDSIENSDKNRYDSDDYDEREFYVYKDQKVLENVCRYLMLCCKKYLDDYAVEKERKLNLKYIYEMFSNNNEQSIERKITNMVNFIEEYRKDVLCELDEKRTS